MSHPRLRALLSLGLIGCMTLSLLPLGCSSVNRTHFPAPPGSPRIPDATEARIEACVEELRDEISHGYYSVDAKVEVDKDGRVVDVETKGAPNPEVGICLRMALREMRLPEGVFETGLLRTSSTANGQAMPDRGQMGEVVTIVVVTVVFTEVIIEAFAIAVGVTVTATLATGLAEAAIRKRAKWENECNRHRTVCLGTSVQSEPGDVWNSSRCNECYKACMGKREWPDSVAHTDKLVSCWYPGIKW